MDQYLGELNFDPSPYFRSDVRQIIWTFLQTNDIDGLYWFIQCQSIRWVLVNRFGYVSKTEKLLLSQIIETIPSSSHECLCRSNAT